MARTPAVRLGEDIWRLRLLGDWVNGYALREPDGQVTLIDTGLSRSAPAVLRGLAAIGVAPEQVTRVLVSHVHPDHVGALAEVRSRTGDPPVSVHEADADYLADGHSPPHDERFLSARLMKRFTSETEDEFEPVEAEHRLADGEVLDVAGGLRVLHTPGHSPGHVSFVHERSGTLITGDALFHPAGWLRWSIRPFCTDFRLSQQTAQRFADISYTTAAFMHGPQIASRAKQRVDALLASWDGASAR
jgi:glyoxylase-like metal-dependent hydrolase (beta-lactamase superfamily II)